MPLRSKADANLESSDNNNIAAVLELVQLFDGFDFISGRTRFLLQPTDDLILRATAVVFHCDAFAEEFDRRITLDVEFLSEFLLERRIDTGQFDVTAGFGELLGS